MRKRAAVLALSVLCVLSFLGGTIIYNVKKSLGRDATYAAVLCLPPESLPDHPYTQFISMMTRDIAPRLTGIVAEQDLVTAIKKAYPEPVFRASAAATFSNVASFLRGDSAGVRNSFDISAFKAGATRYFSEAAARAADPGAKKTLNHFGDLMSGFPNTLEFFLTMDDIRHVEDLKGALTRAGAWMAASWALFAVTGVLLLAIWSLSGPIIACGLLGFLMAALMFVWGVPAHVLSFPEAIRREVVFHSAFLLACEAAGALILGFVLMQLRTTKKESI